MTKYQILHPRKKRNKLSSKKELALQKESLLKKAKELFVHMKKNHVVKQHVLVIKDMSIRIDLIGVPQVSFTIALMNSKLHFITDKIDTDMAIGMHKDFFLRLTDNPPQYGNMKIQLFNNIFLRRGNVLMFHCMKPILVNALLGEKEKKK
ncbi:hypothetical protein HZA99_06975 [Candidatus Woesearchaeota archaeon]|nr:hypothetical protein [Candidatus Woesearchaeota archaeon]